MAPTPGGGSPTALDLVTLVIAVLGFVLSVAALIWQIVSWRYTGSVVKVKLEHGFLVGPGVGPDVVSVTAMNVGRTPVSVRGWGLVLPDRRTIWPAMGDAQTWIGPAVPLTLGPGESADWNVTIDVLRRNLDEEGVHNMPLRGFVNLATGKRCTSRNKLRL